ncbi:MAG: efflux system, outer rane lipoprotein NodT family [Hydrocarboniphaga sp.]|uniref:efflux transporter outer membrane subunit n=1 Tax=Hydrocarboniphaga sp. TaxID=2033016 RepID=UPI00260AD2DC|nr:efflux transporter outer membrane subunit [Hydrocarboniphaga sp.]MDB5971053.1 efflux system, outer rane lipoprotein NodT family [Hydrocarboniphaga sp.]
MIRRPPLTPLRQLLPLLAAALVPACSLAPPYQAPAAPASSSFKEAAEPVAGWQPAQPADAAPRGHWWAPFADPKLDELQAQLAAASPDLQAAVARYEQARALARQSQSGLYPSLSANAAATRAGASANAPGADGVSGTGNDFLASLNLSWEIDVFGRLRNARNAADRRLEASAGDLAALQLSLQAELASQYFQLRGTDADIGLLEDSLKAYQRALDLTRNRYEGGIAAAVDVDQAETTLNNTRAQLAAARLQRAQLEHGIAVLLGFAPSAFSLPPAEFVGEPPVVVTSLPSTLLQRRPDIASAERQVAAANAEIGVAKAAWFPVFGFSAGGGYEATRTSDWFDAPSRYWSIGPSVTAPILDGGALSAIRRQSRAAFDEAVANYRKSVLTAYQEVEDNLAALRHLADEVASDETAAAAAQRSLFHANKRYASGVASYLEVTTTQTAALSAQRAALDARVRRVTAAVQLVRALGGGWSRDQLEAADGAVSAAQAAAP